jgi:hypothetical protein
MRGWSHGLDAGTAIANEVLTGRFAVDSACVVWKNCPIWAFSVTRVAGMWKCVCVVYAISRIASGGSIDNEVRSVGGNHMFGVRVN